MKMKLTLMLLMVVVALAACDIAETAEGEFTGNEVVYTMFSGSEWGFSGEVSIREKTDGKAQIEVRMENTEGNLSFPVHLHYNSYDKEAELAALLNPLSAGSGLSITNLEILESEEPVTYEQLVNFNGHIKIHMDDSRNKDIILAYGNIGMNSDAPIDAKVAQCFD